MSVQVSNSILSARGEAVSRAVSRNVSGFL